MVIENISIEGSSINLKVKSLKANKINIPLARLIKERGKEDIISSKNKKKDITTDPTDILKTIVDYYEYANELYNLDEMDTFLEKHRI